MTAWGLKEVTQSEEILTNDGFFPNVSIADFQNQFHQVSNTDSQKIKYQLINSMIEVNHDLKELKASATQSTLAETDTEEVAGQNVLETHYFRSVFSHAKGNLLPIIMDVMTKEKADSLETNREELKREFLAVSNQAIRTLLGLDSATVALI